MKKLIKLYLLGTSMIDYKKTIASDPSGYAEYKTKEPVWNSVELDKSTDIAYEFVKDTLKTQLLPFAGVVVAFFALTKLFS